MKRLEGRESSSKFVWNSTPCTSGCVSLRELFRDRESSCLPISLVQKDHPPFSISVYRELPAQLTTSIFFSLPRGFLAPSHVRAKYRARDGKWKWILKRVIRALFLVSCSRLSMRRDFLNNRMASLGVARRVLPRFSRVTASCLTFYGRRESYRPMVFVEKCLYI